MLLKTLKDNAVTGLSVGAVVGAAAGGAYLGVKHAPGDADADEKFARGGAAAFGAGLVGAGAVAATRIGVFKSGAKFAGSQIHSALKTRAGMFMAGGAALGAGIGAYADHDSARGAAIGAGVGAAAGGAAHGFMVARRVASSVAKKAASTGRITRAGMKGGVAGAAILGTIAVAAGAHALMDQPEIGSYSSTGEDGSTRYSDAPIRQRMARMNATGDVVLGLHHKRRG